MKETTEYDYEKQLNVKIEDRLKEMEHPDYVFAKRFEKHDYLLVFIVVVFSLALLIYGAYL